MSARSCKIVSFLLPILALALADQLCSVTARAAQRFDITCGKFFADADPPAAVRTKLAERRDVAAQACIDARGNLTRYSPITIVVQLSSGVCMFKQFDFPTAIPDLSGPPVRTINIGTFMTPPLPVCPRQDDPRFYPASGVSEGVFLALLELANSLSSSREGFDAAFALPRDQMSTSQQRQVSEMRGDLLLGDPVTRSRYTLRGVGLAQSGSNNTPDLPKYWLNFVSQDYEGNIWRLRADLTRAGFKIDDFMKLNLQP